MSILEAFLAGKEARRVADAQEQINAMQQFVGQNGQAIMAGDQNALGQLAGFGVQGLQTAMGIQSNVEDRAYRAKQGQRADLTFQQSQEDREAAKAEAKRAAAEALAAQSAELTKEQLAAEQERLSGVLAGAAPLFKSGDEAAYNAFLVSKGYDPKQYPMKDFPSNAVMVEGTIEAIKEAQEAFGTPDPADEYGRYVAEETAKGRTPLDRIGFEQAKKGKGMSYTTQNADGSTTTFSMGGPATGGAGDEIKVGDVYNPAAATDAVNLINDILGADDKGNITPEGRATIERITGTLEGGGGNDINAMSPIRRGWYGDKGVDKIEKLGQLESKAWLAARDMLKGGGPITDYESRKAEAAVARLSRAKGPEEFIAALTELRDAITAGEKKLREARAGNAPAPATTPDPAAPAAGAEMSDEELLRTYGGE